LLLLLLLFFLLSGYKNLKLTILLIPKIEREGCQANESVEEYKKVVGLVKEKEEEERRRRTEKRMEK
jgi:hypothetical protein